MLPVFLEHISQPPLVSAWKLIEFYFHMYYTLHTVKRALKVAKKSSGPFCAVGCGDDISDIDFVGKSASPRASLQLRPIVRCSSVVSLLLTSVV
jgi:hypothetical protein